jgi:hypothetical protein
MVMTYEDSWVLDESHRFASYVQRLGNPARITYGSFPNGQIEGCCQYKGKPGSHF